MDRISTWDNPTVTNNERLYATLERLVRDNDLGDLVGALACVIDDEAARYQKRTGDSTGAAQMTAVADRLAEAPELAAA